MKITVQTPNETQHFGYPEDAREYIEGIWNDKLVEELPEDDESVVMLQEDDDEVEDGRWAIYFHTESELSDEANEIIERWLKETNLKDESDKIMAVIKATVNVNTEVDYDSQ